LGAVLPEEARRKILEQFAEHRQGVVLESPSLGPSNLLSEQQEDLAPGPDANQKAVGV
jgi:hypothetical protein